jgi:transposase
MGRQRDHGALARRRLQAVKFFRAGQPNSEIARRLGVHRQSVGVWRRKWVSGGKAGLASKGPAGPKSRLTPAQEELIAQKVLDGAVAAGHPTEVWTLPRLARLIQDECGVTYHPGHVWHLLDRLGFSCQQPSRRAIERNEPLIQRWQRHRWPALKKSLP